MRGAEGGKLMDVWGVEAGLCCWPNMLAQNSSPCIKFILSLFRFICFVLFCFVLFYFMLLLLNVLCVSVFRTGLTSGALSLR